MKRILVLQEILPKYRIPVFSKLAEKYSVTIVTTSDTEVLHEMPFEHCLIKDRKVGPFRWVPGVLQKCKQYDVVIYMTDFHFLNYCLVPLLPHNYKTISYSIGFRASYSRRYDLKKQKSLLDRLFGYLIFKADAVLVYFKEVLTFWKVSENISRKCFETRNTVEVKSPSQARKKNSILFVGTLYKEKKVDVLINAYHKAISLYDNTLENIPSLIIIGGGKEADSLKRIVEQHGLESKVHFTGPIYDESELACYYAQALISVSPNQAGLSVPHSLGYGVPFVTTRDAITGGEILHIQDGVSGVLMDNLDELPYILLDVFMNPQKYEQMGNNALDYYNKSADINIMVKGFDDAIQYVL